MSVTKTMRLSETAPERAKSPSAGKQPWNEANASIGSLGRPKQRSAQATVRPDNGARRSHAVGH
jgi:hypothetical protein